MAITSATFALQFSVTDTRLIGLTNVSVPVNYQPGFSFTAGTGALQGDLVYQGTQALVAGTNTVDLSGVLTDAFGAILTPLRIKVIAFRNNSTTNIMTLGAAASNPWVTWLGTATSTKIVRPGGAFIDIAPDATGWAVTAGTADMLKVAGTGTDTFDLLLLGASA